MEIPGRSGVSKTQKFKAMYMYEAKLEFSEGLGGGRYRANPFRGGGGGVYGYFRKLHNDFDAEQLHVESAKIFKLLEDKDSQNTKEKQEREVKLF